MSQTAWRWLALLPGIAGLLLSGGLPAAAHEHRTAGSIDMSVGWGDEPTYAGFRNSVQVILSDKSGKPITDVTDTLKVEVRFGSQTSGQLTLERAFGKAFGRPGDYRAQIVPTRPGVYSFRFVGTVHDQKIDETFTSSDKTFDNVVDSSEIQFPVKDPSAAELSGRVERLGPRLDEARASASQAATIGLMGFAAGLAGLAVGLGAMRRRRGD